MKNEDIEKEHLSQLYIAFNHSSTQFDKNILFIASGALGLSMNFINDFVVIKCASFKFLLFISWIFLVVVILASLVSHYLSIKAVNKKIEHFYNPEDKKSKNLNSWVQRLNIAMIILLILALIILISFIFLNL